MCAMVHYDLRMALLKTDWNSIALFHWLVVSKLTAMSQRLITKTMLQRWHCMQCSERAKHAKAHVGGESKQLGWRDVDIVKFVRFHVYFAWEVKKPTETDKMPSTTCISMYQDLLSAISQALQVRKSLRKVGSPSQVSLNFRAQKILQQNKTDNKRGLLKKRWGPHNKWSLQEHIQDCART